MKRSVIGKWRFILASFRNIVGSFGIIFIVGCRILFGCWGKAALQILQDIRQVSLTFPLVDASHRKVAQVLLQNPAKSEHVEPEQLHVGGKGLSWHISPAMIPPPQAQHMVETH